jgi:hypothetical protein
MRRPLVGLLVCLTLAALYLLTGTRLSLIAQSEIEVWADREARASLLATLPMGSELDLLRCAGTTADPRPEVRLADGRKGVVARGVFSLRREPLLGSRGGRIQHSCR